jgi:hypothetical protein
MMVLENSNYNLQRMPMNIGKIAATRLCHKSLTWQVTTDQTTVQLKTEKNTMQCVKVYAPQKNK